jgi:catechol 2,3-dioxygenase-like lactoylglutathione lyase family enzyme
LIHHVALEVRRDEADACVAFWRLLGFAEVAVPETLRDDARWLQRGGQQVHLMFCDEPVAPPAGHVALVADDYDATLDRLRDAGFEPDPRRQHWGSPRAFARSPAGHRVELMMFPPG